MCCTAHEAGRRCTGENVFNGGNALTEDELKNYSLHIDYSTNGDRITQNLSTIELKAELKIKGKTITKNVEYYWFR